MELMLWNAFPTFRADIPTSGMIQQSRITLESSLIFSVVSHSGINTSSAFATPTATEWQSAVPVGSEALEINEGVTF